ncbi:T9SS type A sorting domain-containing protein [candidate division WOR-3 bacterium]|nr:T9SS type A sorting domain-containing protein [candidate division WOR-3 bacterium]
MSNKFINNRFLHTVTLVMLLRVTALGQTQDIVNGNLIQFNDNGAWCWYQDERAVIDTLGGKLVVGSIASDSGCGNFERFGDVEAVVFDLESMTSQRHTLREGGGLFYCDDHHAPGLLVRPDGKYTAFYAAHFGLESSFFRIYDSGVWGTEYEFSWDDSIPGGSDYQTTYSNLYYLSDEGRMFNFSRGNDGGSPNFMYSDNGGDRWAYGGQLTAGIGVGGYTKGYYKYWGNGVNRIDFICTETHPRNYNTSIYHAYIQDGKVYNSFGAEVDSNIYDKSFIPTTDTFTTVFAANTVLNSYTMTHCWNMDVQTYEDGIIATIISARTGGNSSDPDHAFIYCRFDGSSWTSTYLCKAGKKMYFSEEDYVGLAAIHPSDPNIIYVSTPYNPSNDATFLGVREIFKGVSSDDGATWDWTDITVNSERDNFRPIIPKWDENNMALLWFRGTYFRAQEYDAAIVGLIEHSSDSIVLMTYVDASTENTFLSDGSTLTTTGPDDNDGAADNQWHIRTSYGNGNSVLTSAEIGFEDAPIIKTQITDIEEGTYDVWANFWANPAGDWRIKAGLNPDNMQIFRQMACKQVMSEDHDSELVLTGEGNTFLYQAYIGRVVIEADDTLNVFIDDEAIMVGTAGVEVGNICRTWYDGISYSHPGRHPGNISIVEYPEKENFPLEFSLNQNHPNPFNSITNISYKLSEPAHVRLSAYNMLGQEVAELINGKMSAGSHSVEWDARNISSGIYFLKITVGDNSITKKALLAR